MKCSTKIASDYGSAEQRFGYELATRSLATSDTVIELGNLQTVGGNSFSVIAGPCAVESEEQIIAVALELKRLGVTAIRGGAFKPRSSTYSFQGLGAEGLRLLRCASKVSGLPVVSEIIDHTLIELFLEHVDVLQVGARNMHNVVLLRELGRIKRPVLLKRGMMATIDELLQAAEYILAGGNSQVILCERGLRSFDPSTRNVLDLSAVPVLIERTHLPVIVDPSHGTGVARYVPSMSKAALAAGSHGIMVEVHPDPESALSDGFQALNISQFERLLGELDLIGGAVGRIVAQRGASFRSQKAEVGNS